MSVPVPPPRRRRAARAWEAVDRAAAYAAVVYRLAIDLGTSNTVAVLRDEDGRIRPVLFDGREQLPSAVHAGTGGALVAGPDAERLARADPAAFEPNPKRRVDDGTVLLGRHTVDVADVLAAVLSAVASRLPASPAEGCVVLTVPAGWGSPRREVLAGAAERAGLGAVEFLSEPVAAAAYFTATLPQDLPPGAALLVVDLGAGTADLAVVRGGRVVAQGGLDVGGLDVDAALVGVLGDVVSATEPEVWHRLAAPATAADRRDRLLLWQEVRAAKESLSRLSVAPVHVPGCRSDPHLTREELEAAAAPLLARIADLAAALTGHQPVGLPAAGVVADPAGTGGSLAASGVGPAAPAQGFTAPDGGFAAPAGEPAAVAGEAAGHAGGWPRSFSSAGEPAAAARPAPARPSRHRAHHRRASRDRRRRRGAARHGGRGAGGHRRAGRSAGGRAGRRGGVPRRMPLRRRWRSPATVLLVLLCFALPFATVSCGLPDGYGRAQPGGTSEYTGFDLASGGAPAVREDQLRPPGQRRPDRLDPQPAHVAALLLLAAVLGAVAIGSDRRRRMVTAALGGLAALVLVAGQVLVLDRLAAAVVEQSRLPAGKTAGDMVGTGPGFWLAVTLLGLLTAANVAALAPARRRSLSGRRTGG